jgi:thermitase
MHKHVIVACILVACINARADTFPNDPGFPDQWALSVMHAEQAWQISLGSPDVEIGVLDTGVVLDTPDLQGRFLPPLVASTGQPDGTAVNFHGTWVLSTIGMTINNGIGGAGTGNFSLLPIRITDASGNTTDQQIIQGIDLAAQNNCRVITISFLASSYTAINNAVEAALTENAAAGRKDFLVFMSAGNGNTFRTLGDSNLDDAQARLPDDHLIMVGGTNESDQRWVQSSFTGSDIGPFVDLAAPADSIFVANGDDPSEPYGYASGTSFSAPYAASAAALAFSINPNLTAPQVQNILFDTAFNPDNPDPGTPYWDETYGWGRVDLGAVAAAAAATVPEPASLCVLGIGSGLLLLRRPRDGRHSRRERMAA